MADKHGKTAAKPTADSVAVAPAANATVVLQPIDATATAGGGGSGDNGDFFAAVAVALFYHQTGVNLGRGTHPVAACIAAWLATYSARTVLTSDARVLKGDFSAIAAGATGATGAKHAPPLFAVLRFAQDWFAAAAVAEDDSGAAALTEFLERVTAAAKRLPTYAPNAKVLNSFLGAPPLNYKLVVATPRPKSALTTVPSADEGVWAAVTGIGTAGPGTTIVPLPYQWRPSTRGTAIASSGTSGGASSGTSSGAANGAVGAATASSGAVGAVGAGIAAISIPSHIIVPSPSSHLAPIVILETPLAVVLPLQGVPHFPARGYCRRVSEACLRERRPPLDDAAIVRTLSTVYSNEPRCVVTLCSRGPSGQERTFLTLYLPAAALGNPKILAAADTVHGFLDSHGLVRAHNTGALVEVRRQGPGQLWRVCGRYFHQAKDKYTVYDEDSPAASLLRSADYVSGPPFWGVSIAGAHLAALNSATLPDPARRHRTWRAVIRRGTRDYALSSVLGRNLSAQRFLRKWGGTSTNGVGTGTGDSTDTGADTGADTGTDTDTGSEDDAPRFEEVVDDEDSDDDDAWPSNPDALVEQEAVGYVIIDDAGPSQVFPRVRALVDCVATTPLEFREVDAPQRSLVANNEAVLSATTGDFVPLSRSADDRSVYRSVDDRSVPDRSSRVALPYALAVFNYMQLHVLRHSSSDDVRAAMQTLVDACRDTSFSHSPDLQDRVRADVRDVAAILSFAR